MEELIFYVINYHDEKIRQAPTCGVLNSCFDLIRFHQQ